MSQEPIFFVKIALRKPLKQEIWLFERLVGIRQQLHAAGSFQGFFDDLLDACVMECYFAEHMAERDLLFHDEVAAHLEEFHPNASESDQKEYLEHFYRTLNASDSKIRNRLLRISADSPDLLAVIKEEGQV